MDFWNSRGCCTGIYSIMVKILGIMCVILIVSVYILFSRYEYSKKQITTLEIEKNNLVNIVKGYQNAEVEANKTINRLRKTLESSKANMDWYNTPIPFELLDVMQKRHNRNRKN